MDHNWVTTLSANSLLAVYDVLLDVRAGLDFGGPANIPILPSVVRFPQLMPADGIQFRDEYANQRWRAAEFLRSKHYFLSVAIEQGSHRWESRLSIDADLAVIEEVLISTANEHRQRTPSDQQSSQYDEEPESRLRRVIQRFHQVALELRRRREDRETLVIRDEYDVQDLLRALLTLFFDDVRPEEWTPSYAGKASRVDFLLKNEGWIIEAKKTRRGHGAKEIGDELIIDAARYRSLANCNQLICLVYDPEEIIANFRGFEGDLSRIDTNFTVKVHVIPR